MVASAEAELDLLVTAKDRVADQVVTLDLEQPQGRSLPAWTPGSHIDVLLPDGTERQYSLCSPVGGSSRWRIAVLREPESRGGSQFLHDRLAAGDSLRVRGPRNHFELVEAPDYLFIAGGIGITPLLPMIEQAEAAAATWSLTYGGRTRSSMAFADDLQRRHPAQVHVLPQDEAGLLPLQELVAGCKVGTLVYCCGPEPLLVAIEEVCAALPPGSLHVERFAPKHVEPAEPLGTFLVELAQSGLELEVHPEETILEVLVDAGIDVATSCTEGVCGTCETRVLSGIPDHLDSVLSEQEQAANDTMFVCVSRSRSPRLLLDL